MALTFSITILGTNAALPGKNTITSAQVLNVHDHLYLIDCGEGTQMKMQQYHIKRNRIDAVFISHLHGDHVFGLPGLLTSYAHFQRKTPLQIYGPKGIRELVETMLRLSEAYVDFEIRIVELEHDGMLTIYKDTTVRVSAFPLRHRIATYGYRFDEQNSIYNIRAEAIRLLGLTKEQIRAAKAGEDIVLPDGAVVLNHEMVYQKSRSRSFAYCSDTAYDERLVAYIEGVDVLYHEATYLSDMAHQAEERLHSTVKDAAGVAVKAGVGKLVIGHFSTRYGDKTAFLAEGLREYNEIILADEGKIIEVTDEKNL